MFRLVFRDDTLLNDSTIYARKLKPRPSHAASSRSLRRSKKYAPKSNTGSKKRVANQSPSTTGKSSWSTPLTPTSASGMMEKTEMCGSLQQPFYYRLRLTAHVTFMPVPATCTVFLSTPDRRCSSDLKYCDFLLFLHLFFPFVVDHLRAFVVNTLTPTSSFLGMMEKTGVCGSLQQPFYYRLRFTVHETFMPVPVTRTLLVSKTSPTSCA